MVVPNFLSLATVNKKVEMVNYCQAASLSEMSFGSNPADKVL